MEINLFMSKKKLPLSLISIVYSAEYIPITLKSIIATQSSIVPEYGSYIICPKNDDYTSSICGVKIVNADFTEDYSLWILKNLKNYISSEYSLIHQWDSCVIDQKKWTDDFLDFDYIGAPWGPPLNLVGNGGFSLRSSLFIESCSDKDIINSLPVGRFILGNEDFHACCTCKNLISEKYKVKFPTLDTALRFSVERVGPEGFDPANLSTYKSFGFHGDFNTAGMSFLDGQIHCYRKDVCTK